MSTEKRKSSFIARARKSFLRSGGERGASVETLRGTNGADFEGNGRIRRGGASGAGCFCLFGDGDAKKEKILLVKGPFCFVFKSDTSSSPLYAISLVHLTATQKLTIVTLETELGDVDFEITFGEEEVAKSFCSEVTKQSKTGQATEIKKRLGHEHLLNQRKSVMYAETIAQQKVKDQPELPVTHEEIVANMPMTAM